MARKALEIKCRRNSEKANRMFLAGKKVKFSTKLYHRCSICGRVRGYYGKFDMCRICIRERANSGELIGVRKSSW